MLELVSTNAGLKASDRFALQTPIFDIYDSAELGKCSQLQHDKLKLTCYGLLDRLAQQFVSDIAMPRDSLDSRRHHRSRRSHSNTYQEAEYDPSNDCIDPSLLHINQYQEPPGSEYAESSMSTGYEQNPREIQ